MIQFVIGAAAGYVFGTKAGRKRYYQLKDGAEKVINSPITKNVISSARRAAANKLDPEPRMREIKDLSKGRYKRDSKNTDAVDKIYAPDTEL